MHLLSMKAMRKCENKQYENFLNSIPPEEHELNLDIMYQMNHNGNHITTTELSRFKSKLERGHLCK